MVLLPWVTNSFTAKFIFSEISSSPKEYFKAIAKGAYPVWEVKGFTHVILSTGSEVSLAIQVARKLLEMGVLVRVVSMPCWEVFSKQTLAYQQQVIPNETHKIAIEAGSSAMWYRWVGAEGQVFALDEFGHSAPADQVYRVMGLTVDNICSKIHDNVLN